MTGVQTCALPISFTLGRNVNVAESVGEYKDGVLRVDVHTTTQRNDTFNVPIH